MNSIFKVIFNRSLERFEIVSELAKGQAKSSSGGRSYSSTLDSYSRGFSLSKITSSILTVVALGVSTEAYSAAYTCAGLTGLPGGPNSIVCGNNAQAVQNTDIAIGYRAFSDGVDTNDNVGTKSAVSLGSFSFAKGSQSIALGARARAEVMQSIVIGNDTRATGVGAVAIGGDDSESYSRGQSYPVVGYMVNGLDYRPTFSAGNGSTAISPHAQALTQGATAIGVGATAGKGTMSTVSRDPISGLNTAIWTADNTGAKEATAIGAMAAAAGLRSTAVGYDATASGTSSVAIGSEVDVTGSRSIVIGGKSATGEKAETTKDDAIAIGAGTKAILEKSVALGSEAKTTRVLGSYRSNGSSSWT